MIYVVGKNFPMPKTIHKDAFKPYETMVLWGIRKFLGSMNKGGFDLLNILGRYWNAIALAG